MYQSQVRLVYAIPGAALGTCPNTTITDQITDQNTPYCGELAYAVCNDIRVLAVIRCIDREPSPPRCATNFPLTLFKLLILLTYSMCWVYIWYTIVLIKSTQWLIYQHISLSHLRQDN